MDRQALHDGIGRALAHIEVRQKSGSDIKSDAIPSGN